MRAITPAVALLLAACQPILGSGTCTLIGCTSGLEVELSARPAGPYRIEAFVDGAGARYVYDCADPAACLGVAIFSDFTPSWATVQVTTAAGTRRFEVRPQYRESRPNGGECPPVCRTARVTLTL